VRGCIIYSLDRNSLGQKYVCSILPSKPLYLLFTVAGAMPALWAGMLTPCNEQTKVHPQGSLHDIRTLSLYSTVRDSIPSNLDPEISDWINYREKEIKIWESVVLNSLRLNPDEVNLLVTYFMVSSYQSCWTTPSMIWTPNSAELELLS
jgi:hypothetical protein